MPRVFLKPERAGGGGRSLLRRWEQGATWTTREGERLPAPQLKPEVGPGLKSGFPGPESDPTIRVCCLLALTRCISCATACSSLEGADAVRPCLVTESAPVVWSRDGQFLLPSCFYLEPGVRAQIGAAVFCGTTADPTTQLRPGWGPAQATAHTCGLSWVLGSAGCAAGILGMW